MPCRFWRRSFQMRLSKDVEPYFIGLRKCYTQYRLRNIVDFSSFYAIRLYELLIHQMNLRMDLIRRGIAERNERIGLHPSEEMFETQVRNYQFRFLRKMLGAKIDFVTEEIIEETNTVVGNRERAMERLRANFTPQRGRERARYVKGDNILSRVLRVSENALVVEASGYEVAMTIRQVTPMAVVLPR